MSPLPREMPDRWHSRPDPEPGQAHLYWHILMNDQPDVRALADLARDRLARFQGLHYTPHQWLHTTVLMVGPATGLDAAVVDQMIEEARQRLRKVPPVSVTFGRVLYHPEAITLGIEPARALDPCSKRSGTQLREPREAGTMPRRPGGYRTSRWPTAPQFSQPAQSSPPSGASYLKARSPSATSASSRSTDPNANGTGGR